VRRKGSAGCELSDEKKFSGLGPPADSGGGGERCLTPYQTKRARRNVNFSSKGSRGGRTYRDPEGGRGRKKCNVKFKRQSSAGVNKEERQSHGRFIPDVAVRSIRRGGGVSRKPLAPLHVFNRSPNGKIINGRKKGKGTTSAQHALLG